MKVDRLRTSWLELRLEERERAGEKEKGRPRFGLFYESCVQLLTDPDL
jgi:hypothetical protein